MPITIEDLTVNFEHVDRAALLADWEWLIGPNRLPILISFIGDAFVQDSNDGTVHVLDPAFAVLEQVAASPDELATLLADRDATDIDVHFSLTGQLQRQIAELPEGTPISEIRIEP